MFTFWLLNIYGYAVHIDVGECAMNRKVYAMMQCDNSREVMALLGDMVRRKVIL